jgi:hypothetical protein
MQLTGRRKPILMSGAGQSRRASYSAAGGFVFCSAETAATTSYDPFGQILATCDLRFTSDAC